MRKLLSFVVAVGSIMPQMAMGQTHNVDLHAECTSNLFPFKSGDKVVIRSIVHEFDPASTTSSDKYYLIIDGAKKKDVDVEVSASTMEKLRVDVTTAQDIWNVKIIEEVLPRISAKGFQYEIRKSDDNQVKGNVIWTNDILP